MRYLIILFLLIILVIQFIPVEQNNPPVLNEMPMPANVKEIMVKACYDCHSNLTKWQWYSKIAPISFLISHDVNHGREYLNFSEWNPYKDNHTKIKKEIWKEINDKKMPPLLYRILNSRSKLTEEEKKIISNWAISN